MLRINLACCGLVVFLLSSATAAEPKLLPQKLLDEGWISLFDSETLFGWQPVGDVQWEIDNGEIRTAGVAPGFLMTTAEWADYELHVEFKADAKTNSGLFLRTPLNPTDPTKDCIELNIAPRENPFPTTSLVGRLKTPVEDGGAIHEKEPRGYRRIGAARMPNPWDGGWHTLDVTFKGTACEVALDGIVLSAYFSEEKNYGQLSEGSVRVGRIGLQSREGPVAFRNIRLRPLGLKPLLDGKDLTGWSTERAEKSKFEVTKNGELHLTNGPGQIDTNADFTNFVLQFDCKVNGDSLNSGIFFRALRDARWAGYESQINNKFKDGDRTKPADFGTGAIYRRQPARRIVANDHEWFTKTIVANGAHMAVWVNGYQVTDWTDERPEKENAREGKKVSGGAIAIQGHDPTTDFLFRNIKATELPR